PRRWPRASSPSTRRAVVRPDWRKAARRRSGRARHLPESGASRCREHLMRLASFCLALTTALLGGCAGVGSEKNEMEQTMYHYAAAVRWGEVEQILAFHDPKV